MLWKKGEKTASLEKTFKGSAFIEYSSVNEANAFSQLEKVVYDGPTSVAKKVDVTNVDKNDSKAKFYPESSRYLLIETMYLFTLC